jgi:hypothetical protein
MNIYDALRVSKSRVAKGKNTRTGKTEFAMNTAGGIRIIKSVTDPTVVKKLSPSHWSYQGWEAA